MKAVDLSVNRQQDWTENKATIPQLCSPSDNPADFDLMDVIR